MWILQFGFTGISSKNGKLFGKYTEYPMKKIEFLCVTVTHCPKTTRVLIMDALKGLAKDENWLIENSAEVEEAKNRAFRKMTEYLDNQNQKGVEYDAATIDRLRKEVSDLKNENRHLRNAFTALTTGDVE